jgi:hypothetical protein
MTDYKALCARMADELDHYRQLLMDDRHAKPCMRWLLKPAPPWPSPSRKSRNKGRTASDL